MVTSAASGRPASEGVGAVFIQNLKRGRVAKMMMAIVVPALGSDGLLSISSALLVGGILAALSGRVF
ncbi:MAG: hypothetical protein QXT81_06820 [Candidatus Bathyarchaeia archaeon]